MFCVCYTAKGVEGSIIQAVLMDTLDKNKPTQEITLAMDSALSKHGYG